MRDIVCIAVMCAALVLGCMAYTKCRADEARTMRRLTAVETRMEHWLPTVQPLPERPHDRP